MCADQLELNLDEMKVILNKEGAKEQAKLSYPVRYGRFHEIRTPAHILQFNLNAEIKFLQGRNGHWPHPAEWLKRTLGNDWVYYFSGGYSNVYDCLGEYYVPCFTYASNSLWSRDPFQDADVQAGWRAWSQVRHDAARAVQDRSMPASIGAFLQQVAANSPSALWSKATRLFALERGRMSVLPPDARHVDYDLLPVVIADGCLYNCGFCSVKAAGQGFQERSRDDIRAQLKGLRSLLGPDAVNYNALFLGQHDALNCRPELIEYAATQAYEQLELDKSLLKGRYLFLFGSVDSLNKMGPDMISRLQNLPFDVYINIGLESTHQPTLDQLRKPITSSQVARAYERMLAINAEVPNVEVTANMVMGWDLDPEHWHQVQELTQNWPQRPLSKGAVYLSPLSRQRPKDQIRAFQRLKRKSKIPLYLYVIQRL